MKKIITAAVIAMMVAMSTGTASAASDYDLAKDWKVKHAKGGRIEKLNTTAKGGYKGKVNGAKRGIVRYPKKVKKGKKVKVYLVYKKGENECSAMICLGKVK